MIWSKLKQRSEELLAPALQGRVAYHLTRYGPGVSGVMTRGWITLDGHEVISCSTITQVRASYRLSRQWYSHDTSVEAELHRQGVFTRQEFVEALEACLSSPIDQGLQSAHPLTRALALWDRRVGKRRLRHMTFSDDEMPIVTRFYWIRCQAEGIA